LKYIKVYNDLKQKIQQNIYTTSSSLQGEEYLCELYDTSRTTIRKALEKLKHEGYIHSKQGSGIFVNPPEFYEEKNLRTLSEKIEKNVNLENVLMNFNIIEADQKLAEIFNLSINTKMIFYKRLRKINNIPKVLEVTYMPKYLFKNFSEENAKGAVLRYIEKECNYGISHDIKNVTAIILDKELSETLEMPEGTATLQIEHKVYLIKSILAQYTKEIQVNSNIRFVSVR